MTTEFDYRLQAADTGFRSIALRLGQTAYMPGPEKRLWEHTFAEVAPSMVRTGVATTGQLNDLFEEMRLVAADERVFIAQACLPGVIAVK